MVPLHEGLQQDIEIENVESHSLSISFRVSPNLNNPTHWKICRRLSCHNHKYFSGLAGPSAIGPLHLS